MAKSAREDAAATLPDTASARRGARSQPLAVAFVVSLLAHVLLLSWLSVAPVRKAVRSDPVIALSAVIVAPATTPPAAAAMPAPQPAPVRTQAASLPSTPRAVAEPRPAAPDRAAKHTTEFVPGEALAQPPAPLEDPLAAVPIPELVGRRLAVTVWVLPDGTVRKAEVRRNEIPEDVAIALEQAIGRTRFVPGHAEGAGAPVAAVLSMHLCFGDEGLLDTQAPECWRPAAPER